MNVQGKENKIKFAVIGCGHIGKRHASMIVNNPACELAALVDIRAKDELGLEQYSCVPFFGSIDELIKSNLALDVISIASPNGFHEEQALKALDSNCHIVIEKPMALSKAGCERIIFKAL